MSEMFQSRLKLYDYKIKIVLLVLLHPNEQSEDDENPVKAKMKTIQVWPKLIFTYDALIIYILINVVYVRQHPLGE